MSNKHTVPGLPTNDKAAKFKAEWSRRTQEILRNIYSDPDLVDLISPEDAKEDLLEMGIDPSVLPVLWRKILATREQDGPTRFEKREDVCQRGSETAEGRFIPRVLHWLKDLRDHVPHELASARLTTEAQVEAPTKQLLLTEHGFTESDLATRLPWAKPLVKLSKTGIDRCENTALFLASIPYLNQGASERGVLKITLVTPSGAMSQVCLTAKDRKKIFEGAAMPLDSSELRYFLCIE